MEPVVIISICKYASSRVIYTINGNSYRKEFSPDRESCLQSKKLLLGALNFQQGVSSSLYVQFSVL